jgi:integrase
VEKVKATLRVVWEMYGDMEAAKFNAVSYAAIRIKLVESGLCISTIRARLGVIKRMIAWGIAREMIPDKVRNLIDAFEESEPLRVGQPGVKPSREVKPAPPEHIAAILPHINPTIRAMIQVQALTGARPGEIWRMTTGQIDRTVDPWLYRPTKHKTAHHGKTREIHIGPQAQAILLPWFKADPDAPLFSPIETVERRNTLRRASRKTPHTPSSRARARKRAKDPKRAPRQFYDKNSCAWAIARGCLAAGVPVFNPNQIRHTRATEVRREFSFEHAQVVLGHSKPDMTARYAEADREKAREVARKIG